MMTLEKETILEKIQKLKAMQDSANELGNEHEAAAFADKVQSMLFEHKLEMSEVEDFDITDDINVDEQKYFWDDTGIPYSNKRSHWLTYLGSYVAKYNGCTILTSKGTNRIIIVGTEESRNIVGYILSVLARFGKTSCDKAYGKAYYQAKKEGTEYLMKGFKRAFLSAFVNTIGIRLKEANEVQLAGVSERGLVVIDAEAQAVQDFIDDMKLKNGTGFRGTRNQSGRVAGAVAGNEANLGYNAVGTDGKRIKNLS